MRKALMWTEAGIALVAAGLGAYLWLEGSINGHKDPVHGGAYVILGGMFLLVVAVAFGLGAFFIRGANRWGWLAQVFPLAIVWMIVGPLLRI